MVTDDQVWGLFLKQPWAADLDVGVLRGVSAADLLDTLAYRYFISDIRILDFCCLFEGMVRGDGRFLFPDLDGCREFDLEACVAKRFVPVYCSDRCLGVVTDNPFRAQDSLLLLNVEEEVQFLCVTPSEFDHMVRGGQVVFQSGDLLMQILRVAVEKGATDVHFYAHQTGVSVSFRLNQRMVSYAGYGLMDAGILKRSLKFESDMDVANQWVAQDGTMSVCLGDRCFDVRVASYPSVYGEDFVCRLFYGEEKGQGVDHLGCSEPVRSALEDMMKLSSGLVLVNGPTGAGKTTTIYACLKHWRDSGKNVVTIEDPVEVVVEGVRQSSVNEAAGFGVEDALRGVLRQDPDVILIGEIRDAKVAQLALQVAFSGHIVVASFHAGSVRDTLLRLSSFQLDLFLLHHCLKWVFCQKLVSKKCRVCCENMTPQDSSRGCEECAWTGVSGVVPAMEFGELWVEEGTDFQHVSDTLGAMKKRRYRSMAEDLKSLESFL